MADLPRVSVSNIVGAMRQQRKLTSQALSSLGILTVRSEIGLYKKGGFEFHLSQIFEEAEMNVAFKHSKTDAAFVEETDVEIILGIPANVVVINVTLSSENAEEFDGYLTTSRMGQWWRNKSGTLSEKCAGDMRLSGTIRKAGRDIVFRDAQYGSEWFSQ